MLYNDAYIPSMADRHPDALGPPVSEVWGSSWEQVAPPFLETMSSGKGFSNRNVELPMIRRGRAETTYWDFSAAPIRGEDGSIVGLLNQGTEIMASVLAAQKVEQARERQQRLLDQMPSFVGVLSGPEHVYEYVNDAYISLAGRRRLIGLTIREAFPELEGQGFYQLLDQVYTTGQRYVVTARPVLLAHEPSERFIDFLYEPTRDGEGVVTGIFVGGYDVTDAHRAAQSLRELNTDLERQVVERSSERGTTW